MTGTIYQMLIPIRISEILYQTYHSIEQELLISKPSQRGASESGFAHTVKVDIQTAAMMKLVEERSFNSHGRRLVLDLLNFCNSRMATVISE